jgi:hypothetical protein
MDPHRIRNLQLCFEISVQVDHAMRMTTGNPKLTLDLSVSRRLIEDVSFLGLWSLWKQQKLVAALRSFNSVAAVKSLASVLHLDSALAMGNRERSLEGAC